MAGTEVAKKETAQIQAYDYGDHAHEGFEGIGINDLSIPFINVLQPTSPEIVENQIEGCRAGDLLNSVTREILSQPVVIIPVHREEAVVEWIPRSKGGGIAGRHSLESDIFLDVIKANGGSRIPPKDAENKRISFKSPAGNELVETFYIYCLILDQAGESIEGFCVLSFTSTKIKVYKDFISAMYGLKGAPPIYANRAKISTAMEKRESGTSYNYRVAPLKDSWRESLINPATPEGEMLLSEALKFRDMIKGGLAKPDYTGEETEVEQARRSTSGPAPTKNEDEIPF
jgi:hypothetical protein